MGGTRSVASATEEREHKASLTRSIGMMGRVARDVPAPPSARGVRTVAQERAPPLGAIYGRGATCCDRVDTGGSRSCATDSTSTTSFALRPIQNHG